MILTFEDFKPGHFGTFGPRHITREEIVAFAQEYDAQPMHLDDDAANVSILKGLSGSGWHMCALMMRMIFDGFLHRTASMGSPGVDRMRWIAPFRPGDDLTLDVEVLEARGSNSRPTLGIVTFKCSVSNAKGMTISEMTVPIMIGRREAALAS
jgi:acyl dehydratase